MSIRSRAVAATLVVAVTASTALLIAPLAHAASYRYWAYWHGDAQGWHYANSGAGTFLPDDGSVEGWRLSIGGTDAPVPPTAAASFSDVCAGVTPRAGQKRVALVIDPGPAAIAPAGETPGPVTAQCVQVRSDGSGYDVLAAASSVRTQNGFVCGIGGYPATECSTPVDDALLTAQASASARPVTSPSPSASASTASVNDALGTDLTGGLAAAVSGKPSIALAILVILAALGWLQWKRRRG